MTGFSFDAKAALEQARKSSALPNLPNRPNRSASGGAGLGGLGGLGTVRASDPEMTPEELARDLYEERAAIREYDGGQDRAEAEAAAWQEAMRAAGIMILSSTCATKNTRRRCERNQQPHRGNREPAPRATARPSMRRRAPHGRLSDDAASGRRRHDRPTASPPCDRIEAQSRGQSDA